VVVLIAWIVAVAVALVVLGAISYGLLGSLHRLSRAVETTRRDLGPTLAEMQPPGQGGRHSA
jgi:hypothetical protein